MHYGVAKDTEDIDYDQMRDLAREHRPKMIIAGGSAIPRTIDFAAFRAVADEVGAVFMVDAAHFIGLVAGGAIPSPVPHADVVTFTTHKVLRGPRGGMLVCKAEHAAALDKAVFPMMQGGPLMQGGRRQGRRPEGGVDPGVRGLHPPGHRQRPGAHRGARRRGDAPGHRRHRHPPGAARPAGHRRHRRATPRRAATAAGIVLNKNAIPYDPQPASVASGIRVGTPSVTTQGMGEVEMKEIGGLIARAVRDEDGSAAAEVRRDGRRAGGRAPRATRGAEPRAVREYLLVLLRRRRGHLPADARWRGASPCGSARWPSRATGTCTPSRPRGWAAWRCTAGCCAAMLVAHQLPALRQVFTYSDVQAVLVAGGVIVLLGVVDDTWGLDALTKLAGQVVAAGVMVLLGLQLLTVTLPGVGAISLGPEGVPLTVLLALLTINAINFVDGLDGLAAGVGAIAALAFFAFSYSLSTGQVTAGVELDRISSPTLLAAVLAGACLGFLPHNFSPARLFMGDSGSMLIGLMLAGAVTSLTGQFNYSTLPASTTFPALLPLLLPVAVLAVPFVDLLLAVSAGPAPGARPSPPTRRTCTTGCWRSATATPGRC